MKISMMTPVRSSTWRHHRIFIAREGREGHLGGQWRLAARSIAARIQIASRSFALSSTRSSASRAFSEQRRGRVALVGYAAGPR